MGKLKIIGIIVLTFLVVTFVYLSSATFPVVDNNVLLYFKLDKNATAGENNTFVRDSSSYGRNGTIYGNPTFLLGAYDNALKFDGNGDFINISNMYFDNETGWAVSMWIKPISTNNKPILLIGDFNTEKGFEIFWSSSDLQFISLTSPYNIVTASNNNLPVNEWRNLIISYSNVSNNFTIYINGTYYTNISITPIDSYTGNIFIGMPDEGIVPQDYFNGTIDELILFNKSLSSTEVTNLNSNYTNERFSCGELYEENKVYNLVSNISSEETCFEVTANNITINGDYNFINFSLSGKDTKYGIYSDNHSNIKINNLKIYLGNVTTSGSKPDNNYGLYLVNTNKNTSIENCSIYTFTRENYPLQVYDSLGLSNINILNSLFEFSNDNTGYTSPSTMYIEGANINITSSKLNLTNNYGLGNKTIYLVSSTGNLINTTYLGKDGESVTLSKLYRKWYFETEVNDSDGYLETANVTVYNSTSLLNSKLTGTKGNITRLELTEYINNGTKIYEINIINISKTGFITNSTTINLTKTNNTFLYVTLVSTLSVNIAEPRNQLYNYNESLELNYSIVNYTSLDTCFYSIFNSSNGYEKANTSISGCSNISFNVSGSDVFTLFIYLNETGGITASDSVVFEVSMTAPAIVLNSPSNNTFFNSNKNIYFNYTAIDSNGLGECQLFGNWSGSFIKNYTWNSPTNNTMNFTVLNLSETTSIWNVFCNDTSNNGRFALNNYTFTIDTTYPGVKINSISTSVGSQTFTFSPNITETHSNNCFYSIFNLSGSIDGLYNNISLACTNTLTSAITSSYGTFNLFIYANDSAGNLNYTNRTFTTESSIFPSGGGGGEEKIVEIPSNKTFCGDGVCQREGNDLNVSEDFYTCAQDCEGFNPDSFFFYCVDDDPTTKCIWDGVNAQYIGLSIGLMFAILLATERKDKSGKRMNLARFYLKRIRK